MTIAYVDVIGGAAGDMLLAALIDAGAPIGEIRAAVEAVLPERFVIDTLEVERAGLRARLLTISPGSAAPAGGALTPRPIGDLLARLGPASLPPRVKDRSARVLRRIGDAEARVHAHDDPLLFELGDDDTLLDVVGVAAALEALEVEQVEVSSIPLEAGGSIPGPRGHGTMPLPAPATVELLSGFRVRSAGRGETVTPTAAAIFAALGRPAEGIPEMRLGASGWGAGNRDPQDYANVVRVLVGDRAESAGSAGPDVPERELVVLEANMDDLAPELVADGAQALFAAGALDAWIVPIIMKKGRPAVTLSALCEPAVEQGLRRVFFEATSTFGVRAHRVRRSELERRVESVAVAGGSLVRVKLGLLDGRVVSAKPEHDDVAAVAERTGLPVREVHEEAASLARAFRFEDAEA